MVAVESDRTLTGCLNCGVVAVGHGRRVRVLLDAPSFGRPVRVRWMISALVLPSVIRLAT